MEQDKTVVVLGGGVGGVVAANILRKKLPRRHRVVLVERESKHVFSPSFLWLMIGERSPDQIARPLAALSRKGIEVVRGNIEGIDPANYTVRVDGKQISGDYLVVALGADLAPETVPGLAEAGCNLYALPGAEAINEARRHCTQGRIVVLVAATPFKCPAAPYEAAMLLEYDYRRRGLRDAVQIDIYTPEPGPMSTAGPEVSAAIRQMVESKGIGYHPALSVSEVDAAQRRINFSGGATADYDLLVYVPPHRAPQVVREAGLCGASGWVPVDRDTLETTYPGVYAIGDVSGIMLSNGRPLPKAGVIAHYEAEVVANNIVFAITGKGRQHKFMGRGECFIETGDGRAGFGAGDFYAEPAPEMRLRQPDRLLHLGKVMFEKYWFFRWF